MKQKIIISRNIERELAIALSECEHDKLFVLTDSVTATKCWDLLKDCKIMKDARLITIESTDKHKDLTSVSHVWQELEAGGGTRHSCMINLGGGMVTDLGGFAASTFKRGINFINIPTTLLAMVDASVGGKTGINFNGLKNEIGVFNNAQYVILDADFLRTLDDRNLRSGYGEMLKHSLIANEAMWAEHVTYDLDAPNLHQLLSMVDESVKVKEHFVEQDPHEQGVRKALNFGHTVGHALEAWSLKTSNPLLHGYAVAYGLVCELYLSVVKAGFPTDKMRQTVQFINRYYGSVPITCNDYDELIELMRHDKKNTSGIINFTFLSNIGELHINQTATDEEIKEALDFFREG